MFITNMIPLHAFVLILMGRFSNRLYVGYSSWYAVGTLASMQVPFVGFQPVKTSEHMAALGKDFHDSAIDMALTAPVFKVSSGFYNLLPFPSSYARTWHQSNSRPSSAQL